MNVTESKAIKAPTRTTLKEMIRQCESTSRTLKSLAHPQRLQVLCFLTENERTVGELAETCQISQSQLSQFLQRMKSEGLVKARRQGKFVFYAIADPRILKLILSLHEIFCPPKTTTR